MALYPNKLLPLDLASMEGGEPCDKYVQVLMSPSESEMEFNIALSELECLVKPVDSEIVTETETIASPSSTIASRPMTPPTSKTREVSLTPPKMSLTPPKMIPLKSRKSPGLHKKEIKHPHKQDTGVSPLTGKSHKEEETFYDRHIQQVDIELKKYVISRSAHDLWEVIRKNLHILAPFKKRLTQPPLFTVLPTEVDLAGLILETMFQRNLEEKEATFVQSFQEDERRRTTDDVDKQGSKIEDDTSETTTGDVERLNIPEFLLEKPEEADDSEDRVQTVDITIAVEQNKTIKIVHSRPKPIIKSIVKRDEISSEVRRETDKAKGIHSELHKPEDASGIQFQDETKEPTVLPPKTTDESEKINILQDLPVRKQPKSESPSLSAKTKVKGERKKYTSSLAETTDESENIETPRLPVKGKRESESTLLPAKKKGKSDRKVTTPSLAKTMEKRDKLEKTVLPVKGKQRSESTTLPVVKKGKIGKKMSSALPVKTLDEAQNIDSILARVMATYKSGNIQTAVSADTLEEPEIADVKETTLEDITQGIIQKSPSHRQILKIVSPYLGTGSDKSEGKVLLKEKMSIYPRSEVSGSTRTDLSDTSLSSFCEMDVMESDSSHSTLSDFGEPEDILFFEDSQDQPIVRTRVFTKKPGAADKLPPIKGLQKTTKDQLLEADRKGTTFKRKMSKTMKEQFNQRKPLSQELLIRNVKELDLQQALVVTSSDMTQDSQLKDNVKRGSKFVSKCLKATAVDPKQAVDIYLHTKGINELFQYMTTRLIIEEPKDPLNFLIGIVRNISYKRQFFYQMYKACKGESEEKRPI